MTGVQTCALPIYGSQLSDNTILSAVDGFVIEPQLDFVESEYVAENYESTFASYLENEIFATYSEYDKQILIGLNFPSVKGVERGCIMAEEVCYDFDIINKLDSNIVAKSFEVDLINQVNLYHAAFNAINEAEWIDGVISQEYNPQVAIMDISSSVRGKPANGVFWYWFPRMLGITN